MVGAVSARQRSALSFAALTASALVALFLVYAVGFGTSLGTAIDRAAIQAPDPALSPRVLATTDRLLGTVSVGSLAVVGLLVAGVGLVRRRPDLAVAAVVLVVVANVSTQIAKPALALLDPTGTDKLRLAVGAFPSGHATVAASLALAAVLVAPPGWRALVAGAGAAYAAAMGVTLVLVGWHYPADVAGAYLLTAACAGGVATILCTRTRTRHAEATPPAGGPLLAVQVAVVCAGLLLAAFVLLSVVADGFHLLTALRDRTTFFAAALVLVALAAAVVGTTAALWDRSPLSGARASGGALS